MNGALFRKLLRDLRLPLLVVALLLCAFQTLWAKITDRISNDLMDKLLWLGGGRNVSPQEIEETIFEGPGKIMRTMMGGEAISLFSTTDMLTVGYVHPLMLTVFCIWAIGRASGAIAGEIDRGTMELLLAQPVPRYRVVISHLAVDLLTIPVLCVSLWAGNWLGIHLFEVRQPPPPAPSVKPSFGPMFMLPGRAPAKEPPLAPSEPGPLLDPVTMGPGLFNVAALLFAVSGYTMWISALGRFRWRVLGVAVLLTLVQFLVNVVGQLWDAAAFLRPFTVFYYFQPQQIILKQRWMVDLQGIWHLSQPWTVHGIGVLVTLGVVGYAMALWTFCRRDLPAPL
jgi:ABC-2 type transport system permease protein